ncbi:FtsQ-type POTRA domain-containing protein [Candidatus Saganbacteria bacterium]|nr:FtsQ-type POTRA domain-containing protein [Candidatus Saganbacteria bacterium]
MLLLALFLGAILTLIALLPVFKLEEVQISGTRLLLPEEVIREAKVPLGGSIFFTSLLNAKKNLSRIAIVKKLRFKRVPPSKILIVIEERKEAVICVLKNKQSLILDKDGVVLNPQIASNSAIEFPDITNLPVMNGLDEAWLEQGRYIRSDVGRDVLKLLAEFETFIAPQKLQIDVADLNDIKLLVDDILRVRIGSVQDLNLKMRNFEAIYSKNRDRKNEIEYIDVSSYSFPAVKYKH